MALDNLKVKKFFKDAWDILVFVAYIKIYIIILTTFGVVLALALYILDQAGQDITLLGNSIQIALWFSFFWVGVVMIDKFLEFRKKE